MNDSYKQLSSIETEFLKKYKIPLSCLFNAEGIPKKEYRKICKEKDIPFAFNTTPCKKDGHQIRTRSGHCLVCDPEKLSRYREYLNNDPKQSKAFNYSAPKGFNGDFVAFDVETATGDRSSICAIGIVEVEDFNIINKSSFLIQPPGNKYSKKNSEVHGIDETHTVNQITFVKRWDNISKYFDGRHIVAHYANFDLDCLGKTLGFYGLSLPKFTCNCTYKIYNDKLENLCKLYKIKLKHHDPLSDAIACAKLYIKYHKEFSHFTT